MMHACGFNRRPTPLPVMQGVREEQQAMAAALDARWGLQVPVSCERLSPACHVLQCKHAVPLHGSHLAGI